MDFEQLPDRRTYLKYTGVAAITALAGCGGSGNGGDPEPNHEVPHPNDDTVPDAEINAETLGGQARPDDPGQGKDQVGYEHVPSGEENCGNCNLYVPDQDEDGFGACAVVNGKIHPCDFCNLWAPYDGDDAVECSM